MDRLDLEISSSLVGWPFWLLPSMGLSCLTFLAGKSISVARSRSIRLAIVGLVVLIATTVPSFGYMVIEPLVLLAFVSGIIFSRKVTPYWVTRLCNAAFFAALLGWVGYEASHFLWQWPRLNVLSPLMLGLRDLMFSAAVLILSDAGRKVLGVRILRSLVLSLLLLVGFVVSCLFIHYCSRNGLLWQFWPTFGENMLPAVYNFPLMLALGLFTRLLNRVPTRSKPVLSAVLISTWAIAIAADHLGVRRLLPTTLGYFIPGVAFALFFAWLRLRPHRVDAPIQPDHAAALALLFLPVSDSVWAIGAALLGRMSVDEGDVTAKEPLVWRSITITVLFYSCFRVAVYFGIVDQINAGWRFFIEVAAAFALARFFATGVVLGLGGGPRYPQKRACTRESTPAEAASTGTEQLARGSDAM